MLFKTELYKYLRQWSIPLSWDSTDLQKIQAVVSVTERSTVPDSSFVYLPMLQWVRVFWSPDGGVGSNPTPDSLSFCQHFHFNDYLEKELSIVILQDFNLY